MANAANPKAAKITDTARTPPDMPPNTASKSVISFIEASKSFELRFFFDRRAYIFLETVKRKALSTLPQVPYLSMFPLSFPSS
jgi:hypothetical protein